MKCLSIAMALLAPAIVSTQSVSDLPSCSLSCFATAVGATGCSNSDYTCQCKYFNAASIKSSVTSCLAKSTCTFVDLQKVQTFSNTFCLNIIASASSAAAESTSAASPSIPTSFQSIVAASTTAPPAANTFGAGTAGTAWGTIKQTNSKASRGPAFEAVSIILLALAALVFSFRIFARFYTKSMRHTVRSLGLDELFAVLALICTAGITANIIVGVRYGMGKHTSPATTSSQLVSTLKVVYSFVVIIFATFGFLKISILCLYLRMTPERSHHIVIYSVLAFTVAVTFSGFVGAVFQCTPVSSYWDLVNPLENPKCINILAFDTFNLAMSVLEDIIIWALPLPVVWNLKVPRDRKMGLYGLIAISFIAVICAIVRLSMLFIWLRSADIAWNYLLIPFLSNMEACVALITSSIPAIWPLFRRPEQPKVRWGQPPLPTKVEPIKAWDSRDSQDWTTWRSTGDRSSKRWSFWSGTRRGDAGSSRHLSTVQSEGMRTDVKELFDHGDDILPGLAK